MKLLAALFLLTAVFALAFSALLIMPVEASAAEASSFGSVWSGLVERVDGETAYVRLESCLALWRGDATYGCGAENGSPEPVAFHFGIERVARFAQPLDLVPAANGAGWLPEAGERVTVRETFARACGENRPGCDSEPVWPTYTVERPVPATAGATFWLPAILGGLAAAAGAWMLARSWQGVSGRIPLEVPVSLVGGR